MNQNAAAFALILKQRQHAQEAKNSNAPNIATQHPRPPPPPPYLYPTVPTQYKAGYSLSTAERPDAGFSQYQQPQQPHQQQSFINVHNLSPPLPPFPMMHMPISAAVPPIQSGYNKSYDSLAFNNSLSSGQPPTPSPIFGGFQHFSAGSGKRQDSGINRYGQTMVSANLPNSTQTYAQSHGGRAKGISNSILPEGQQGQQFATCCGAGNSTSEQQSILLYCEPCDKEFAQKTAYEAHCASHESCKHPGCSFSATKKVVIAHFHSAHGQFSGSGYKMIDVEGQKFRVLLGTCPDEVKQWREDRRKRFPTAATVDQKQQQQKRMRDAGGVSAVPEGKKKKVQSTPQQSSTQNSAPVQFQDMLKSYTTSQAVSGEMNDTRHAVTEVGGNNPCPSQQLTVRETSSVSTDVGNATEPPVKKARRCLFFSRGKCKAGDECKFSHDFEPIMCTFFVRGRCRKGISCPHIHDHAARADYRSQQPQQKQSEERVSTEQDLQSAALQDAAAVPADQSQSKTAVDQHSHPRGNNRSSHNNKGETVSWISGSSRGKGKGLYLPQPLNGGARGTLLRKLLEDQIVAEENLLLQCLRFMVAARFFDSDANDASSTTLAGTTSISVIQEAPAPALITPAEPDTSEGRPAIGVAVPG